MDKRSPYHLKWHPHFAITALLILFLGIPITCCTQKDSTTGGPAKQTEEGSAEFNSEDGLLKLELIGYTNAVESFSELTVGEANTKISVNEEYLLFVGRPTCEWCRRLAPFLQQVSEDRDLTIFYLDSTNTETDSDLANFKSQYDIPTVPAVILFESDGSFVKLDIDLQSDNVVDTINSSFDGLLVSS